MGQEVHRESKAQSRRFLADTINKLINPNVAAIFSRNPAHPAEPASSAG